MHTRQQHITILGKTLFRTLLLCGVFLLCGVLYAQGATSSSTSSAAQNAGVPGIDALPGIEITPEQMKKYFPAPLQGSAKSMETGGGQGPHVPILPMTPAASSSGASQQSAISGPHIPALPTAPSISGGASHSSTTLSSPPASSQNITIHSGRNAQGNLTNNPSSNSLGSTVLPLVPEQGAAPSFFQSAPKSPTSQAQIPVYDEPLPQQHAVSPAPVQALPQSTPAQSSASSLYNTGQQVSPSTLGGAASSRSSAPSMALPPIPSSSLDSASTISPLPNVLGTPVAPVSSGGGMLPLAPMQAPVPSATPLTPAQNQQNVQGNSQGQGVQQQGGYPPLEIMIGQMIMGGFTGTDLENTAPILTLIKQGKIGGVFLEALPPQANVSSTINMGQIGYMGPNPMNSPVQPLPMVQGGQGGQRMQSGQGRQGNTDFFLQGQGQGQGQGLKVPLGPQGNIASPTQVRQLTATLQRAVSTGSAALWVAIEHEGGTVQSLRKDLGFEGLAAAALLGQGTVENTEIAARRAGIEMASLGINFVLGPAADVNVNPLGAYIGKRFRSFGPNPAQVAAHVLAFSRGILASRVMPCIRNFPGTGSVVQGFAMSSSTTPNFLQTIPDLASSWQQLEATPYAQSIAHNYAGAMQPALVYHRGYDALYPVPLSKTLLNNILRGHLGFKGLILSPDLRALQPFYSLQDSILLAITAGVDILLISEPAAVATSQNTGLGGLDALGVLGQGLGNMESLGALGGNQDPMQEMAKIMQDAKDGKDVNQSALSKALLQQSLGKVIPGAFQAQVQASPLKGVATQVEAVYATLLQLVKNGRISEARIRQSWGRVQAAKAHFGLTVR